jgi:hypothetical protein
MLKLKQNKILPAISSPLKFHKYLVQILKFEAYFRIRIVEFEHTFYTTGIPFFPTFIFAKLFVSDYRSFYHFSLLGY